MVTLNKKEIKVVDYLMQSEKSPSQNRTSHDIGIPKTSLSRIIDSLEKKNILTCEKIGKYKKLQLTKWFLAKK